jgi:hypothetical protein
MAQRKNSVTLTETAIARLQVLVSTGEFENLDDAASHVITSNLRSTGQYSPVLTPSAPIPPQVEPMPPAITPVLPSNGKKPRPPIEGLTP